MPFPPEDHVWPQEGGGQHYAQSGQGEILLLIHGSLCDYRYWRWQYPALGERYHVLAPSLRGYWPHAQAHPDPAFSIARHAQDMAALIRQMAPGGSVHVLGHSRGAQVALALAFQAPELVRSLTLADPGFRLTGETQRVSLHSDVAELLERGEVEPALSNFVDAVNGAGTWRQMTSWFKSMARDNGPTLLSQAREAHPAVNPQSVAALPCPLLLIGGEQSPSRYRSRIDALQQACPAAQRETIPMAAHGMNLANPRAFNKTVLEFLSSVPAMRTDALI